MNLVTSPPVLAACALIALSVSRGGCAAPEEGGQRLAPPPQGKLYHGVFPGGYSGMEDDIEPEQVRSYEQAVGRRVAWVYFSHNWYAGAAFPRRTAEWIREMGAIPFIRLMLREEEENRPNRFGLDKVLAGVLDEDLRRWGRAAKSFGTPLIVEFGTEVNGDWFPWNGAHHGGGRSDGFGDPAKPDGPERFVAAYRRIVDTIRGEGASNITWVFHVNAGDWPEVEWNRFERYWPGEGYADWLAVSAYGPQEPRADEFAHFREMMDPAYRRLRAMAPGKPIVVAEFGCTAGSPLIAPEAWAGPALADLLAGRWPEVIGFSWWNERWQNDDDRANDSNMRVEEAPALAAVLRERLAAAGAKVVERPIVERAQ